MSVHNENDKGSHKVELVLIIYFLSPSLALTSSVSFQLSSYIQTHL